LNDLSGNRLNILFFFLIEQIVLSGLSIRGGTLGGLVRPCLLIVIRINGNGPGTHRLITWIGRQASWLQRGLL
jgi:hypothetical protein